LPNGDRSAEAITKSIILDSAKQQMLKKKRLQHLQTKTLLKTNSNTNIFPKSPTKLVNAVKKKKLVSGKDHTINVLKKKLNKYMMKCE
ncbi:hypothetical protein, partial [Escherichia coli]|uniref:hypothetical protein n=1 Tax=Escherichia coli TaxID=562 RepID=UPI0025421577